MRLVVDANVAYGDSARPMPLRCQQVLQTVLSNRTLYVVLGPKLKSEWDRHQSEFAATWRRAMWSKKRMEYTPEDVPHDARVDAIVAFPEADNPSVLKDVHLLDAALYASRRVISRDDHMREWVVKLATTGHLPTVHWASTEPRVPDVIAWLRSGAPDHADFEITAPRAPTPKKKPAAKPVSSRRAKKP